MKMHTILWLENLKGRDHSKDTGVESKITTFEWILRNQGEMDSSGSG